MTRYTFDVVDDGPVEWDDEGIVFADHCEIELHVRALIVEAQKRQVDRGSLDVLTTVFVHPVGGSGILLTATARPGEEVSLVWVPV